jgi:hypothetical protein
VDAATGGGALEAGTWSPDRGHRAYGPRVIEIGTRAKGQPAPEWVVHESLTRPMRPEGRPWLVLLHDEHVPEVLASDPFTRVLWGSIWDRRPDAQVRFDLEGGNGGTHLRWTLLVDQPDPGPALTGHMCKRLNQLVNAELRYSFGG